MLITMLMILLQVVSLSRLSLGADGQVLPPDLREAITTARGTYRQAKGYNLDSSTSGSHGNILVYHGVDRSRGDNFASNVTAYVQFSGETSGSSTTTNLSNRGDYWIVNSSFSDMSGEVAFAGYTSDERTTLVSRWFTVQALATHESENRTAYIDIASGRCINYTLVIKGPAAGLVDTYFANDTNAVLLTYPAVSYVFYNIRGHYMNPDDPTAMIWGGAYEVIQSVMNTSHALNVSTGGHFALGPHGPYPLLDSGRPVTLQNAKGEALSHILTADAPPTPSTWVSPVKGCWPLYPDMSIVMCTVNIVIMALIGSL